MKREGLDTIEALLYLAHYWKELGQMAEAEHYCLRLLDFAGKVRAHARSSWRCLLVARVSFL
jgi:anaphase-promoting complex subunit 8